MSAFFVYDSYGNISNATTNYPNVVPPSQLLVLNDEDTNVQLALANPSHYMVQSGGLVQASTIQLDRSYILNGSFYLWTIAVSTNDNQSHSMNVNVLNHSETITVPANGTTYQIAVHQSIENYKFDVLFSGDGLITKDIHVGDTSQNSPIVQVYKDANGLLHIAPAQKTTLVAYYSQQVPQSSMTADIGTAIGLLMDTVFGPVLTALMDGSTPLLTLDDNQKNALADIRNNILPNILTKLEEAAPKPATGQPQTYDLHYASLSRHMADSFKAFNDYASDIQNIPNLV